MRNKPDNSDLVKDRCVDLEPEIRAFLFGILRDTHDVEDVFQRTVVKAIEASSDVNPETLRGWLFKIALNEARASKRSQSLAKSKIEDWRHQFARSSTADVHPKLDGILSSERQESIDAAVMRLPKNQREVINRRIRNGQKFADIAVEMNRPLGTILTWMRRALNSLREMREIRDLNPDADHSASGNSAADENR